MWKPDFRLTVIKRWEAGVPVDLSDLKRGDQVLVPADSVAGPNVTILQRPGTHSTLAHQPAGTVWAEVVQVTEDRLVCGIDGGLGTFDVPVSAAQRMRHNRPVEYRLKAMARELEAEWNALSPVQREVFRMASEG